jgi:hypothetical protein
VVPRDAIEYNAVKVALGELQNAEKVIITLLEEQPKKKRCRSVDYTGMDTIEPYDEYDGITDIWYDLSIWYDSDYDPENEEDHLQMLEDEKDDENFDNYVVYTEQSDTEFEYREFEVPEDDQDYSEDEDYEEEDEDEDEDLYLEDEEEENEIFEIMVAPRVKRQNTHIRFLD